jgi:hypothetical protein
VVNTPSGEDWFLHFQDKEAYGRVVHLQPMKWINNCPLLEWIKMLMEKANLYSAIKNQHWKILPIITPAESDEFNANSIGLQWHGRLTQNRIGHFLQMVSFGCLLTQCR